MIILDTETGGLDCERDALVSVALYDTHTNESLHLLVKPVDGLLLTSEAERVHGITREKLEEKGILEAEACSQVESWMQAKRTKEWCGHNPSFDAGFVNAAMKRNWKKYRVPYRAIDLGSLAYLADKINAIRLPLGRDGVPSRSLDSVLQAVGKSRAGMAHDALQDAMLTGFAFQRIMTLVRCRTNAQNDLLEA